MRRHRKPQYFMYLGKHYGFRSHPVDHKVAVGDFLAMSVPPSAEEMKEAIRVASSPHVEGKVLAIYQEVVNGRVAPIGRRWSKVVAAD